MLLVVCNESSTEGILLIAVSKFALGSNEEITSAIKLVDRLGVHSTGDRTCRTLEVTIKNAVKGFNPAKWTANFADKSVELTDEETSAMLKMFDNQHVPTIKLNSIELVSSATITSKVCGFNPAKWTLNF